MQQALALARAAQRIVPPNPAVGCVILAPDGRLLGQGQTQRTGGPHAEVMALRDAAARGHSVEGALAYVTLEPCAHHGRTGPCCDALIAARVGKVIASLADPNPQVGGQGFERLRAAGIAVEVGPGAAESRDGLAGRRALYETIRRMITDMTADVVATSQALLLEAAPADIDAVRAAPPLIRFSAQMRAETTALKRFLYANLYRHFQVNRMRVKASRVVRELFEAFLAEPVLLPFDYQVADGEGVHKQHQQARKIADYIAGMTDRYAIREHRRIFSLDEL